MMTYRTVCTPNEVIEFNGSLYTVEGISFESWDAAWEYAANWCCTEEVPTGIRSSAVSAEEEAYYAQFAA